MTRLFRYLTWTFSALAILGALAAVFVYYVASRSLPDYNRSFSVLGTSGRIEIVRDSHAVPHIFAENDENDVYFGLGFAHAQDRLWQMLMLRRTAQGRLSELFGEETLQIDKLLRTLDIYRVAHEGVQFQTPETLAVLQSYSDGVNARLAAIQNQPLGRGAPELFFFTPKIAQWTPTDSIALLKLMALQLSDKAATEVLQARLAFELEPERLADLFPEDQGAPIMALPEYAHLLPDPRTAPAPPEYRHALYPLREPGLAGASNAWAVNASRSATGGTLLANDPHLALTAPSIWMLARLQFPEGGVIGGTIPGIPAILSGRNEVFGWGLTTSYLDDQDFFIERLNPNNPNEYLTSTGFRPFERRDVIIEIKNAPGITLEVARTQHGPVIEGTHWKVGSVTPEGHVAALAWTALEPDDQSIAAAIRTMRARNIDEAREALSLSVAPSQNVTMADGNSIAIQTIGRAPRRSVDNRTRGRIPASGWLAENDWDGFLPFEDNPYIRDPESGVVVNTNNRLVDRPFPNHWSYEWGDDQRILRAERLLNGRQFHTLDSFIEFQTDTVSPTARVLLTLIGQDLWYSDQKAPEGSVEQQRKQALEMLAVWNGDMSEHDPEPLIYAMWTRVLQKRLIQDELAGLSVEMNRLRPLFIERVFRDHNGASIWCDVKNSTPVETCVEMARLSLDEALLTLSEKYGNRIESWRWGTAHQAVHRHEVLGKIPLLKQFVNIIQDTPGGDNTLLRGRTSGTEDALFENVHAAGYRAVYDFADPDASVYVISTGQSGHFLSRHYDDFAQIWRRSEYVPMTLDPVLARSNNRGVTVLTPAR